MGLLPHIITVDYRNVWLRLFLLNTFVGEEKVILDAHLFQELWQREKCLRTTFYFVEREWKAASRCKVATFAILYQFVP